MGLAKEVRVTIVTCLYCFKDTTRRKYCSDKCRQAAYRLSPAYRANLDRLIAFRLARRNRWVAAKARDKALGFDGRLSGHERDSVPPIGQFERAGQYAARD